MSASTFKTVRDVFRHHIAKLNYEFVYMTDATFETAIEFLTHSKTNLRTLDSLHPAFSANLKSTLVTADKILAKNAEQFGLSFQLIS